MPDAEREYREALRVESNLGEAHNNLAVVCMLTLPVSGRIVQSRSPQRVSRDNRHDFEGADMSMLDSWQSRGGISVAGGTTCVKSPASASQATAQN